MLASEESAEALEAAVELRLEEREIRVKGVESKMDALISEREANEELLILILRSFT